MSPGGNLEKLIIASLMALGFIIPPAAAQEPLPEVTTCFGGTAETMAAMNFIRQSVECSGRETTQECRDDMAVEFALATVGASAGVMAALRVNAKSLCNRPTAGMFQPLAEAAPLQCPINARRVHDASMGVLRDLSSAADAEIAATEQSLARTRDNLAARARLENRIRMYSDLNRVLVQNPEIAAQSRIARENRRPMTDEERKFARQRASQLQERLSELKKLEGRSAEIIDAALSADDPFKMTDRLQSNNTIGDIVNRPFQSDRSWLFLNEIKEKPIAEQKRLLASRLKEFPHLQGYLDDLYKLDGLQFERNSITHTSTMVRGMHGMNVENIDRQLETLTQRLGHRMYRGNEYGKAAARLQNLRVAMANTVGRSVAAGGRAVATAGRMGARVGARAVGATLLSSSPWVFAAEAMVTGTAVACAGTPQGPYATYDHECKVLPHLGPQTLSFVLNQLPEKQLSELSQHPEFCKAMKTIYSSLGPAGWKAECTSRGFKLSARDAEPPMAIDYQTDLQGKVSRLRFLSGDNIRPGYSNFGVDFDANEKPTRFLTLSKTLRIEDRSVFEFNDPQKYYPVPADDVLDGEGFHGYLRQGYSVIDGLRLAQTQVQMCCTNTEIPADDPALRASADEQFASMCRHWGVERRKPSTAAPGSAPARTQ